MPRGYRYVIVAAVGWLALCGAEPPQQGKPNQATKAKQTEAPQIDVTPATKPYSPYPRIYDARCYQAVNHDTADLCAQFRAAIAAERAADSTIYANWISGAGALLSFISVVLVLIALGQTRKANRIASRDYGKARLEAKAAAREAEKALVQARKSEERQTRAYVFVDSISIGISEKGSNKGHAGTVIIVRNTGRTPAFNVKHYAEIRFLAVSDQSSLDLPKILERKSETDMPVNGTINATRLLPQKLTRAETSGVVAGTSALFVHGIIRYVDAFGNERTTRYRNYYAGPWPPSVGAVLSFCDDGNEAD